MRHVGTKVGFANLGPDVTIAAPGGNCVNVGAGQPCLYSLDTTTNLGTTTPGERTATPTASTTSTSAPASRHRSCPGVAALMYSVNANLAARTAGAASAGDRAALPGLAGSRAYRPAGSRRDRDQQLSECNCTTATCGAGLAHAPGAVDAALRPVAVVSAPSAASAGATVVLDGDGSLGADGRTITAHAWTLVSGATSLSALAGQRDRRSSRRRPARNVIVRLTVTDDAGRSDSTDATVRVGGGRPAARSAAARARPRRLLARRRRRRTRSIRSCWHWRWLAITSRHSAHVPDAGGSILAARQLERSQGGTMNRRDFFRSSLAAAVATSLAGNRALAALAPIATDLEAVTGDGAKVTLAKSAVQELRDSLRGALLLPGQPGYDEARRVLNASIDKHPALVVQPSGPADVAHGRRASRASTACCSR